MAILSVGVISLQPPPGVILRHCGTSYLVSIPVTKIVTKIENGAHTVDALKKAANLGERTFGAALGLSCCVRFVLA